ncbi:DUF72 domain-containing protein [Flexistipes sinusarabici]|uniref:DUF72 domain-containing protein n=1 Tax=Flexistipes sinusarabici TaxID=2352 RepID=A0A3D5QAH9_FLESI|nr:DUF72 domain-containing protein [Flexistipes sinusarabici]HCW92660.1 DUF72 domain-containing protein [Flexistipes sinusarabici]
MMLLNSTPLYLGTSGYKYDDWMDVFYPAGTSHYNMLEYYTKHFNLIEITFTFYKIPYAKTIQSILSRTPDNVFFSVRLHKNLLRGRNTQREFNDFLYGLSPLLENNKIKAFFADYNYKFTSCRANMSIIKELAGKLPVEVPFFAELPSSTWYKERYIEEFKENRIGLIGLHLPEIPGLAPFYPVSTNYFTYLRLYGKSRLWVVPDDKDTDYRYKHDEIKKILNRCIDASVLSKGIFISYCNVTGGNAAVNALDTKKIVESEF